MRRWQKAALIASCSLAVGLLLGRGAIIGLHWGGSTAQPEHRPRTAFELSPVHGYKAPLPAGARGGSVDSIACPAASYCVGIGRYAAGSSRFPVLVVTGTGATWKATAVELPGNAQSVGSAPLELTCPTTYACIGVGSYGDSDGHTMGLLVTGSGSSWKATQAPVPRNANPVPAAGLSAVSCASVAVCTAIGSYTDSAGDSQGLLLARTGASWSPLEVGADLNAVACAPRGTCVVVGSTYGRTSEDDEGAILTGTGASWKPTIAPLPVNAAALPGAVLESVTCPKVKLCIAVGYYTDTLGNQDGMVLTGYGASWTAVETAHTGALMHVACSSPTACVAVGDTLAIGAGNNWKTIPIPLPTDSVKDPGLSGFYSVSCGPTPICALAGYYTTTARKAESLIVAGSGESWTAARVPLPPDATNSTGTLMGSATCPLAATCIAVGSYNDYTLTQPLIGVYNFPGNKS